MVQVEIIATEELGDRSYIAQDGTAAVVIDPQRDIDRVQRLLAQRPLTASIAASLLDRAGRSSCSSTTSTTTRHVPGWTSRTIRRISVNCP